MPCFVLAFLCLMCFFAFLAFSEQYGREFETIITLLFSVIMLGWLIGSYSKEKEYHPVQAYQIQTCVEQDKTYQIINVDGKIENVTHKFGAYFKENSTVEIKTPKEWYLGVWWPAINEYNAAESTEQTKEKE